MTAGEVAAILPEHQRNEFWDQQIDRYFEAAGDVDLTAELDDDRTGQGALMVTHAILREDS